MKNVFINKRNALPIGFLLAAIVFSLGRDALASQYLTLPVDLSQFPFATTTSLFDHDSPGSPANSNFVRYDGSQWTNGSANLFSCTNAVNCYDGHNGIDYNVPAGTSVLAAAPGTVAEYFTNCGGNTMRIQHPTQGHSTLYAHLSQFLASQGISVARSSIIASSGNTVAVGCQPVGAHLHFGVIDGYSTTTSHRIDPYGWSPTPTAPVQVDPWSYNQGYLWTTYPPSLTVPPPPFIAVSGTISANTTWTPGSVYVLTGTVTVPAGVTLTLIPGTIVKFATQTSALVVNGTLNVQGIRANKIYFTSIYDDAVGGDTNGDGNATMPFSGQYQGIVFSPGSIGSIQDAIFRYGAYSIPTQYGSNIGVIYNTGGTVTINRALVTNNRYTGIGQTAGTLTLQNSEIRFTNACYCTSPNAGKGLSLGGTATLSGNYIYNNDKNIVSGGQITLTSNIITNGPKEFSNGPIAFTGNIFDTGQDLTIDPSVSSFTASGNTILWSYKGYDRSGGIWSNATWAPVDLPYIISSNLLIGSGTLTLQPGVIIKFQPGLSGPFTTGSHINVQEKLNALGTASQKIYITSLYDDIVGGNTYGFPHPAPQPGDFGGINFDSFFPSILSHVVLRYGGAVNSVGMQGGIKFSANSGSVTINNSRITRNAFAGINRQSGSITISQSSLYRNTNYGINSSVAGSPVTATNNWWGSASGPNHPTLNSGGTGNSVSNNITFSPWLTSDPN